ncbi:MAG: hypothetical protein EOP35_01025 [Rubrivivax sp.]|nr:MAG: hypothetical protein EOP35_01025 [Rubrivivax sp.]
MRSPVSLLALAALTVLASTAQAQTALGAGNPTFPIVINKSGSYKLAANLTVPAGIDGIVVASGVNVTLDLGGFQVSGAATCTKAGCSGAGPSMGIKVGNSMLRVFNGTVRGFALNGISVDYQAPGAVVIAEDLMVTGNFNGIFVSQLTANRVVAHNNASYGIFTIQGLIASSMATSNGNNGISMSSGLVRDSRASSNGFGFDHNSGVSTGNTAGGNTNGNKLGSLVQWGNAFN